MNTCKLAIVDDHAVVLDGLKTMLGAFPHLEIIHTAQSGAGLLDYLETAVPDVILMDIQMPGIDGLDLC